MNSDTTPAPPTPRKQPAMRNEILYPHASPATKATYGEARREAAYRRRAWQHLVSRRAILRAAAPGRREEPQTDALARIHDALAEYRMATARVADLERQMHDEDRRGFRTMARGFAA